MKDNFRSDYIQHRWFAAENVGAYEVPPFGAVEVTNAVYRTNGKVVLSVTRPSLIHPKNWAINTHQAIPKSSSTNPYGHVTTDMPCIALYDSAAAPAVGESWGIEIDSFKLKRLNSGFMVMGGLDSTNTRFLCRAGTKAKYIRFSVDNASGFDTTNVSVQADVEDFWDGLDPDPDAAGLLVYNLAISADYLFSGDDNDVGVAAYDEIDNQYRIIQMEC